MREERGGKEVMKEGGRREREEREVREERGGKEVMKGEKKKEEKQ